MSTDLDELLRDASRDPGHLDVDALWGRGRRRRMVRRAAATGSALALIGLIVVGFTGLAPLLGGGDPVSVDPIGQDDAPDPEPAPEPPPEPEPEPAPEPTPEPSPEPSPVPDPAALADPCAPHVDREMEGFIALVAPVAGQQVDTEVEIVGCSNVYEATVQYRIVDPSGEVRAEGFTTATCGSGCVGEFRETVTLPSAGTWTIQVFSESAEDGSDLELTEVQVHAGA
jgi:hypothetical protein